jgi:hypothetical protein
MVTERRRIKYLISQIGPIVNLVEGFPAFLLHHDTAQKEKKIREELEALFKCRKMICTGPAGDLLKPKPSCIEKHHACRD